MEEKGGVYTRGGRMTFAPRIELHRTMELGGLLPPPPL
jgi:hypothetical protein